MEDVVDEKCKDDEPKWQSRYLVHGKPRFARRVSIKDSSVEPIDVSCISFCDIFRGVLTLFCRLHPKWRHAPVAMPVLSVLFTLAVFIVHLALQVAMCNSWKSIERNLQGGAYKLFDMDNWALFADKDLVGMYGLSLSNPATFISFPFVQQAGILTLFALPLLFCVFAVVEKRAGHMVFLGLLAGFWSLPALLQAALLHFGLAQATLYGVECIGAGFAAFAWAAYPGLVADMEILNHWDFCRTTRIPLGFVAEAVVLVAVAVCVAKPFFVSNASSGLAPLAACCALGLGLGVLFRRRA